MHSQVLLCACVFVYTYINIEGGPSAYERSWLVFFTIYFLQKAALQHQRGGREGGRAKMGGRENGMMGDKGEAKGERDEGTGSI